MSVSTDINKFVKEKIREGWSEEFGGKHRKIFHPKGGFVSMSVSPSCPNALNKIRKDVRRLEKFNEEKEKKKVLA